MTRLLSWLRDPPGPSGAMEMLSRLDKLRRLSPAPTLKMPALRDEAGRVIVKEPRRMQPRAAGPWDGNKGKP
jgi:hypothetical protein